MNLEELQKMLYEEYKSNGYEEAWNNNDLNVTVKTDLAELGLIVTEVSEAMECVRDGDYTARQDPLTKKWEGLPIEIVDIIVRAFNFANRKHLDLEPYFKLKTEQNHKRGSLHGRKV